MTINDYWDNLNSTEKNLFQKCCRTLLKKTFIVRDKDDENKKMYYFISKNETFFSDYFKLMNFDAIVSRDSGVVMLQNIVSANDTFRVSVNKFPLRKMESIVLCCLWTLFADRIRSGSLAKQILITLSDLNFELDKYDFKETIDKSRMENILNLFGKFNLIGTVGNIGDDDFKIVLYPSLQFALNENEFAEFARMSQEKMLSSQNETESNVWKDFDSVDFTDSEIDPFDIEFDGE